MQTRRPGKQISDGSTVTLIQRGGREKERKRQRETETQRQTDRQTDRKTDMCVESGDSADDVR